MELTGFFIIFYLNLKNEIMDKELLESLQKRMLICSGIAREISDELGRLKKGDYPENLIGSIEMNQRK